MSLTDDKQLKERLHEVLPELLQSNGLKQWELAERLGVTPATISQYVKGARRPDVDTLKRMANILNCTVNYFLDDTSDSDDFVDQMDRIDIERMISLALNFTQYEIVPVGDLFVLQKKPRTRKQHLLAVESAPDSLRRMTKDQLLQLKKSIDQVINAQFDMLYNLQLSIPEESEK